MPRRCEVKIAVDSIVVNFQRNKSDPDHDFVVLTASGTRSLGDSVGIGPVSVGTPSSGARIGPPLAPPVETQAMPLSEDDLLIVTCRIDNKSHSDTAKTTADGLKVAGAILSALGSGEQLLEKVNRIKPSGVQGQIVELLALSGIGIGAVLAGVGELLGDFGESLGIVEPDCDGPVFEPSNVGLIMLTGKELMDAFVADGSKTGQPFPLTTLTDDKQQVAEKCGHPPSTTVNFTATVTSFQPEVPSFGGSPGPAKTFRPVVGRPRDAWLGLWGDGGTFEGSRIRCTVSLPADSLSSGQVLNPGHAGPVNLPSVLGMQSLQVAIEECLDSPSGDVISSVSDRFLSLPSPVLTSYQGDQPPRIDFSGIKIQPHTTTPAAAMAPRGFTIGLHLAAPATRFADSIALSGGGELQLHVGFDEAGQSAGGFVRYLWSRTPHDGFTASEFMLHPVQHAPR